MNAVASPLNTVPVGPPGTFTTSGPAGGGGKRVPSASYSVEVSVPWLATHHGVVGPAEMPQPLTRFGIGDRCDARLVGDERRHRVAAVVVVLARAGSGAGGREHDGECNRRERDPSGALHVASWVE